MTVHLIMLGVSYFASIHAFRDIIIIKKGLWYKYAIVWHCGTMQTGSLPLHLYISETRWRSDQILTEIMKTHLDYSDQHSFKVGIC